MGSVVVRLEDQPAGPTPIEAGAAAAAGVTTRRVLAGPDRPLWLWLHVLEPGASLAWDRPKQDHLVYVWAGRLASRDLTLLPDEAYVVEHGGRGEVRAVEPSVVLHFHRPEDHASPAGRTGGRAHLLAGCAVRRGTDPRTRIGISLFADASCPGCQVWLHGNAYPPGYKVEAHLHSEDEIIVVTGGALQLGKLAYGRGSVLAVDAETRYGFTAGAEGLAFINFRAAPPTFSRAGSDRGMRDERSMVLNALAHARPAVAFPA